MTRPARPTPVASRLGSGLVVLLAGGCGAALALQHPIAPLAMPAAFALLIALAAWRPAIVPFLVPAVLPVLALAPWSGWIVFEELDLVVLAAVAGTALRRCAAPGPRRPFVSFATRALIWLFALATLISLWRGIDNAGGLAVDLFQSYYDPLNSLRLAKGFLLALLLLPTLRDAWQADPQGTSSRFAAGLVTGLAGAALAVAWERATYTHLLDFSSDYRATGSFWEMHIGGATLDGFLALTFPMALWLAVSARSVATQAGAGAVVAIAAYACLATFSRGVYLAVPLALLVLLAAGWRKRVREPAGPAGNRGLASRLVLLAAGFAAAAVLSFSGAGYRGVGALLVCALLGMALGNLGRARKLRLLAGALPGIAAAAALAGVGILIPKGPYVVFACAAVTAGAMLWLAGRSGSKRQAQAASAAVLATLALAVGVGAHWGEKSGFVAMAGAVSIVLAILAWHWRARVAVWPAERRALVSAGVGMFVIASAVAVFGGGAYMAGRFTTSSQDMAGRIGHWRLGADLLQSGGDWAFGKGFGRFPSSYLYAFPDGEFPGGYRLRDDAGAHYVRLTGSRQPIAFGEVLRVSQRIGFDAAGRHEFSADVRSDRVAVLQLDLCEKHLIYTDRCATLELRVEPRGGWHRIAASLDTRSLSSGPWYAPRHIVLSVGAGSVSGEFDVDNLRLASSRSDNLLDNAGFEQGMARWFFSSDRVHMPWHIKSLFANVAFDMGIVGLVLFLALVGRALWRLGAGRARGHPLAPPLLAGLVGFLVVGLFDSLIDAARLNLLFWLIVLVSLVLPAPATAAEKTELPHA